jgi:hypothetical protein
MVKILCEIILNIEEVSVLLVCRPIELDFEDFAFLALKNDVLSCEMKFVEVFVAFVKLVHLVHNICSILKI